MAVKRRLKSIGLGVGWGLLSNGMMQACDHRDAASQGYPLITSARKIHYETHRLTHLRLNFATRADLVKSGAHKCGRWTKGEL